MQTLAQQLRGNSAKHGCFSRGVAPRTIAVGWRWTWRGQQWAGAARTSLETIRCAARRSRLEAVLFLAREPVSLRKLAQLANLADATEARTQLTQLRELYDNRGCAFQVEQVAGGYQLLSRSEFATWLRPQATAEREIRLSSPALETLAVVAYRQPVLRAEVEAIRGVACGEILRQLMDRDLLRIVGRSEELGRPLSYGTTTRFLQVFGLRSLDELPWGDRLRRSSAETAPGSQVLPPSVDSVLT